MDAAPRRLDELLHLFDRAAAGRGMRRFVQWGTIGLLGICYGVPALLIISANDLGWATASAWSLVVLAVIPLWATLAAAIPCGTAVAAERERGTLDALRLLPFETDRIVHLRFRRRLRFGLLVLFGGVLFYPLATMGNAESSLQLLTTSGRCLEAVAKIRDLTLPWNRLVPPRVDRIIPLVAIGAFILDASRIYGASALSMAVSLRIRQGQLAPFAAVAASLGWALGAVGIEFLIFWLAWLFPRIFIGFVLLMPPLEVMVWHLLIPRRILARARRDFEKSCEP